MKPSKFRHSLAVLRATCGLGQKEIAARVGCATITIQKVENLGLKLSEGLAARIADETGVDLGWLLRGDASAPPMSARREPFTRLCYDAHNARKVRASKVPAWHLACDFVNAAGKLRGVFARANRGGKYDLAAYRVSAFLDTLAAEFGDESARQDWPAARDGMRGEIDLADDAFATVAVISSPGGHDVAVMHAVFAKPTKKGEPAKARPCR